MKIDFQYVFRFLHDSVAELTQGERQPLRPRTSLELQQSEVMVLIAQCWTLRHRQQKL